MQKWLNSLNSLFINLLKGQFRDNLISKNGPVSWPPRSCDLTNLDHFIWGYVKSMVYADNPKTLEAMEVNINLAINEYHFQDIKGIEFTSTKNKTFHFIFQCFVSIKNFEALIKTPFSRKFMNI